MADIPINNATLSEMNEPQSGEDIDENQLSSASSQVSLISSEAGMSTDNDMEMVMETIPQPHTSSENSTMLEKNKLEDEDDDDSISSSSSETDTTAFSMAKKMAPDGTKVFDITDIIRSKFMKNSENGKSENLASSSSDDEEPHEVMGSDLRRLFKSPSEGSISSATDSNPDDASQPKNPPANMQSISVLEVPQPQRAIVAPLLVGNRNSLAVEDLVYPSAEYMEHLERVIRAEEQERTDEMVRQLNVLRNECEEGNPVNDGNWMDFLDSFWAWSLITLIFAAFFGVWNSPTLMQGFISFSGVLLMSLIVAFLYNW